MWSFSRPTTDSTSQNPAAGVCEEGNSSRISLRKFSGYPTEDPVRFLSDFNAYCKLSRINDTDGRRVAAFQLHLQGPANTRYSCLSEDDKADWDNLVAAFELNYCVENTPVLLVETEQFSNLKLLPHQQLEDYYSQVLEKGRKLSKSDQEQLLKFIQGVPAQLAFFVRAGNPSDITSAMPAAKMGEAYGYRSNLVPDGSNMMTVAGAQTTEDISRMNSLEKTVQSLCSKLDSLLSVHNSEPSDRDIRVNRTRLCFSCKGPGHIKRVCNWGQTRSANPTALCSICSQYGHSQIDCKQNQGNFRNPRERGGVPLGG